MTSSSLGGFNLITIKFSVRPTEGKPVPNNLPSHFLVMCVDLKIKDS